MVSIKIDAKEVERSLGELPKAIDARVMARVSRLAAEDLLAKARRRAPFQFGNLRDSDFVDPPILRGKNQVSIRFGFDAPYASIMDQGWKVSVIRPVRAQALYIPLTPRGAKIGPRGIARLKRGVDYTFAQQVVPRKVRKFAERGPNMYFSGTVKEFTREASPSILMLAVARGLEVALEKFGGGGSNRKRRRR